MGKQSKHLLGQGGAGGGAEGVRNQVQCETGGKRKVVWRRGGRH